jgi:phosphoribosyl-AMP cyclohydrolase
MVGGAAYQPNVDAEACPGSGSILLDSLTKEITQCRPASANLYYSFGFRFKGTTPGTVQTGFCAMIFYADSNCLTDTATLGFTNHMPSSDGTTWVQGAASAYATADANSVLIDCNGQAGFGYYDQIYLSSTNATF